jgi:hypothetical protein
VVDDQVRRHQRVDPLRVPAHPLRRVAHRRQIHQRGDAGEILQEHPRRAEGDLAVRRLFRRPVRERPDVVRRDRGAVLVAQEIFEEDLDGEGEAGDLSDAALFERLQAKDSEGVSADGLARTGSERVRMHGVPTSGAVS